MKPKRAILSVCDKTGVVDFARLLSGLKVELLATGKTAELLRKEGIPVVEVADYTGSPEILGGRVKTLHPKIAGGILSTRQDPLPEPIDIVVCNLYPFEAGLAERRARAEMLELIDIGGITLLRAAAKNCDHVTVVPSFEHYAPVGEELRSTGGTSPATRQRLAAEAFAQVARYDSLIARFFSQLEGEEFPKTTSLSFVKDFEPRYGENPHQRAAYYREPLSGFRFEKLQGKELSYNNLLDVEAAIELASEFEEPACVILKHNTPCGASANADLKQAYVDAFAADSLSAFGGIVGFNRRVSPDICEEMVKPFLEVIVAPDFDPKALPILAAKKNLRLIKFSGPLPDRKFRSVLGGLLAQTRDALEEDPRTWQVKSKRSPTGEELKALEFAWKVTKFVRSNAAVLAARNVTTGIGAGQMSRVDAVELAIKKAGERTANSVLATDGFFPFRDSIDLAAKAGIRAVCEPGGSLRDAEVIAAADEHGLALLFTGARHFRH